MSNPLEVTSWGGFLEPVEAGELAFAMFNAGRQVIWTFRGVIAEDDLKASILEAAIIAPDSAGLLLESLMPGMVGWTEKGFPSPPLNKEPARVPPIVTNHPSTGGPGLIIDTSTADGNIVLGFVGRKKLPLPTEPLIIEFTPRLLDKIKTVGFPRSMVDKASSGMELWIREFVRLVGGAESFMRNSIHNVIGGVPSNIPVVVLIKDKNLSEKLGGNVLFFVAQGGSKVVAEVKFDVSNLDALKSMFFSVTVDYISPEEQIKKNDKGFAGAALLFGFGMEKVGTAGWLTLTREFFDPGGTGPKDIYRDYLFMDRQEIAAIYHEWTHIWGLGHTFEIIDRGLKTIFDRDHEPAKVRIRHDIDSPAGIPHERIIYDPITDTLTISFADLRLGWFWNTLFSMFNDPNPDWRWAVEVPSH